MCAQSYEKVEFFFSLREWRIKANGNELPKVIIQMLNLRWNIFVEITNGNL